jgi:hypothetical protein
MGKDSKSSSSATAHVPDASGVEPGMGRSEVEALVGQAVESAHARLLESLGPLLQMAASSQRDSAPAGKTSFLSPTQPSSDAQGASGGADIRQSREQAARTLRLASEKKELDEFESLLPSRDLAKDYEARLRGTQRNPARISEIQRTLLARKGITPDQFEHVRDMLEKGPQASSQPPLSSPSPFSLWGVEEQVSRSEPSLFNKMVDSGLAPVPPGQAAEFAIRQIFKTAADKESKKSATVESWPEFCKFVRKLGVLTMATHEQDPASYWHVMWHEQSVKYLYVTYSWAVAGEYHRRIMEKWDRGFLDLPSQISSEEFRRGDVEGALHQQSFVVAMQLKGGKAATSSREPSARGMRRKENTNDTLCEFHRLWYPASEGHSWDGSKGSCQAAKNALKSTTKT